MADLAAVRRLALALPGAEDESNEGAVTFSVRGKGFVWTYRTRETPRSPRRPVPDVLAVRCSLERKEMLIDAATDRFFDDDHYRGYPAVLVRLGLVDEAEFRALLSEAWRLAAPRRLVNLHDAQVRAPASIG